MTIPLREMVKIWCADVLRKHNGNYRLAARELGISHGRLYRILPRTRRRFEAVSH